MCSLLAGCSSQKTSNTNAVNSNANAAKPAASADATATPMEVVSSEDAATDNLVRYEEGGVQFMSISGWKQEKKGSDLILRPPVDEAEVELYLPEAADYAQATKDVVHNLGKYIKNAKITKQGDSAQVNEMAPHSAAGTGEKDGKPVIWELTIVRGKKPVYVVTVMAPDALGKHEYEVAHAMIVRTIRPLP